MSAREEFLYWIDSQISVKSFFWTDLRWLMFLPFLPFLVVAMIWFEIEMVRQWAIGLGFALVLPWTYFLFKRRKLKMQAWQEPTRFADENSGY